MRNPKKLHPGSACRLTMFCCLALFAAPGIDAQTALSSGLPVAFSFPASGSSVLLNGSLGYSIDVPANAILMVRLEMATANAEVDLYARFGSDVVTAQNGQITADASSRKPSGVQLLFLSNPLGPQAGTCRIALSLQTTGVPLAGRVIATVVPAPAGVTVAVPAISTIILAGQPDGVTAFGASAPINSPVQVKVPLTPGKGVQIQAVGSIRLPTAPFIPPEGLSTVAPTEGGGAFGLTKVDAPQSSLVGVFVGDTVSPQVPGTLLDFTGGVRDFAVIPPVLQQVFYVGNGFTPGGQPRMFVVPTGATRLLLGVVDTSIVDHSGSWTATAVGDLPVPGSPPSNPVTIPATSSITLAGQPSGTLDTGTSVPLNAAVQIKIPLVPGQGIQFRATGTTTGPLRPAVPPEGFGSAVGSGGGLGLAGVIALSGSLVGVFVGDTIRNPNPSPQGLDFSGGLKDVATIPPTLQQIFYVGNGLTPSGAIRTFTVPTGATRLFLATLDRNPTGNSGSWTVSANVAAANAPRSSDTGVVNGAGFGAAPLTAGAIASVFGSNFGSLTSATSVPLPISLGGTQVFFNTLPAPLFFVSPGQINAEIPVELRGESTVLVTVAQNGQTGPAALLNLTGIAPGVFTASATSPVVVNFRTGRLVTDAEPAVRGDTLIIYASGIGPVLYDAPTGNPASSSVLSPALLPFQVTFSQGGISSTATPVFAGLAPGFIGVAQINVQIPADSPHGAVSLRLTSGSAVSSPFTISVQ